MSWAENGRFGGGCGGRRARGRRLYERELRDAAGGSAFEARSHHITVAVVGFGTGTSTVYSYGEAGPSNRPWIWAWPRRVFAFVGHLGVVGCG